MVAGFWSIANKVRMTSGRRAGYEGRADIRACAFVSSLLTFYLFKVKTRTWHTPLASLGSIISGIV